MPKYESISHWAQALDVDERRLGAAYRGLSWLSVDLVTLINENLGDAAESLWLNANAYAQRLPRPQIAPSNSPFMGYGSAGDIPLSVSDALDPENKAHTDENGELAAQIQAHTGEEIIEAIAIENTHRAQSTLDIASGISVLCIPTGTPREKWIASLGETTG